MENQNYSLSKEHVLMLRNLSELCYKALRLVDNDYSRLNRPKGFNLVKRENKKHGFLYYVRYFEDGRMLPSMWNTHTNIYEKACDFALSNRNSIIENYKAKHSPVNSLFQILEQYYAKDSAYLAIDFKRKRPIGESKRQRFLFLIKNRFIPFLKESRALSFNDLSPSLITKFQNSLLANNLRPQTVNSYLSAISRVCRHLCETGLIHDNPFNNVKCLPVSPEDRTQRGCHELDALNGVFNKDWDDPRSFILTLLIYSTDMRNCEIERTKLSDIIAIDDCRFISIKKTKTKNGERLVPLHPFVYAKILDFIKDKNLSPADFIFTKNGRTLSSKIYKKANLALAEKLNLSKTFLSEDNLTFYSGRHFWKTLMNAETLGDGIEEIFMGHTVSSDVAKSYNHLDKRGKNHLLQKTKRVFSILDERLFLAS